MKRLQKRKQVYSKVGVSSDIDGFDYGYKDNDAFHATTDSKDSSDSVAVWVKTSIYPWLKSKYCLAIW